MILVVLALFYGVLTFAETGLLDAWDRKRAEQQEIERRVAYFQHMNVVTGQMLRRLAVESQHDPAIAQLLKKMRVKVIVDTPEAEREAGVTRTVPAAPTVPATPAASVTPTVPAAPTIPAAPTVPNAPAATIEIPADSTNSP